ncbi:maleate cis-trans isomerase family protein [Arenibacterium halophilum]|uniref:Maleate isomerase n=1 Tax=Arenibacterium halophilum TaxID=2583821 RepID=A0ABY2X7D3_9RHOB|nr:aspartate/glutamate racemase family protein [Arenibacterium halophilum]TMV10781.1 Asp/Glu racemase [Arenibacterium halophilum]
MRPYRVGQIVPSSNITMETEIPAMLRAREAIRPERFTFHSSRMRMKKVTPEELAAMDRDSLRCARELADAEVDVMGYACLVAIMSQGFGYHCVSRDNLHTAIAEEGKDIPVVSSAGALVDGLRAMGARKVSLLMPYMKPLANRVTDYIANEGFDVHDSLALEIEDNLAVAARDPMALTQDVARLDTKGVDAVVLSCCVQMPSLPALSVVERQLGVPVTSAAACTVRSMLGEMGLEQVVPDAGAALAPMAAAAE